MPTIADLIAQGENDRVEFKSSMRWDFKTEKVNKHLREVIARTIAGMLNSEGGNLLIGVADDGMVLGIEQDLRTLHKKNADGFQLILTDIVKNYLGIEYIPYVRPRFELVDGKRICVVSVEKSPTPVFLAAGDIHTFWVRMGNSTRILDIKAATRYIQTHWGKDG
jgi:predicted HTH transcriptional regulator